MHMHGHNHNHIMLKTILCKRIGTIIGLIISIIIITIINKESIKQKHPRRQIIRESFWGIGYSIT